MKNFIFQAYGVENIKHVASERRSSNIIPEMVLCPKIYIKIYVISFDLWKLTHLFVSTNFSKMNELCNPESFCPKITYA